MTLSQLSQRPVRADVLGEIEALDAPEPRNTCPACGSDKVVNITPAIPGPDGWGGRCKECGHRWDIVPEPSHLEPGGAPQLKPWETFEDFLGIAADLDAEE